MARKRIGELLLERGVIDRDQLEAGLAHHRSTGQRLGQSLVSLGALTEEALVGVLAQALALPEVDLRQVVPDWSAMQMLRPRFCEQHDLFPYGLEQHRGRKVLLVAMADPLNLAAIEEAEFTTNLKVQARIAPLSAVRAAILKHFHRVDPSAATRASAADGDDSVMTIIQAGGAGIREVDTGIRTVPPEVFAPAAPPVPSDDDAVIEGEEVPGPEDITGRTALANLMTERESNVKARQQARRLAQGSPAKGASGAGSLEKDLAFLFGRDQADAVETLERRFWALLRVMARKGLITPEEFKNELDLD